MNTNNPPGQTRTLAIEAVYPPSARDRFGSDRFSKARIPRIRIMGNWLAAAGFPPGTRATLTLESPGRITIAAT